MPIKRDAEGNLLCYMCDTLLNDTGFDDDAYGEDDFIVCGSCKNTVMESNNAVIQ